MKDITLLLWMTTTSVRTGLRSFLETQQGIRVVAEACNGAKPWERQPSQSRYLLMDISMPDMDGLQASDASGGCALHHILALTFHDDKHYFMEMMLGRLRLSHQARRTRRTDPAIHPLREASSISSRRWPAG